MGAGKRSRHNTSIRGLADIRDHLFGLSEKLQLPILIETTVEKVLKLYKYVGFENTTNGMTRKQTSMSGSWNGD